MNDGSLLHAEAETSDISAQIQSPEETVAQALHSNSPFQEQRCKSGSSLEPFLCKKSQWLLRPVRDRHFHRVQRRECVIVHAHIHPA